MWNFEKKSIFIFMICPVVRKLLKNEYIRETIENKNLHIKAEYTENVIGKRLY